MWLRVESCLSDDPDVLDAGFWAEIALLAAMQYAAAFNLAGLLPAKVTGQVLAKFKRCPNAADLVQGFEDAVRVGLLLRADDGTVAIEPERWRKATTKTASERTAEWKARTGYDATRRQQPRLPADSDTFGDTGDAGDHTERNDTSRSGPSPVGEILPQQPAKPPAAAARTRRQAISLDRTTWKFLGITDEDRARWADMAPHVDLDLKLRALEEWCRSNPSRAPRSRVQAWITGILARDEEKARRADRGQPAPELRGTDPADFAWAEVCRALDDYTGAPGDDEAFASRVPARSLRAVRTLGGASAVARALAGTVTERTQIQRQFTGAWRTIDA